MKRRFNYTGRKRITREQISVILNRDGNSIRSFNANIDLNRLNLPFNAKVYVEAYHRTDLRRYDFGTVAEVVTPPATDLATLAYSENLKFRILVVDESGLHGLILAHGDRIKPESDVDRKPILPVEFRDLGQQVWRVDFTGDEGAPVIVLNKRIPNIQSIARSDPQFIMYVYPAVILEVLTHMIFVEGISSASDPAVEWHGDWLTFAKMILPSEGPPEILDIQDEPLDKEGAEEWINRVVEEFCASRNEWKEYITQLSVEVRG